MQSKQSPACLASSIRRIVPLSAILVAICGLSAPAEPLVAPIEISGFGDIVAGGGRSDRDVFELGQAEINLAWQPRDNVTIDLAVAYDNGTMVLGAFVIESEIVALENLSLVAGLGQFDVPFGLDWQVYPSPDRLFVSPPPIVEFTHDCWNDIGGYLAATWHNVSLVTFAANGFCAPTIDENPADHEYALGGRLGWTLTKSLSVGGSIATVEHASLHSDHHLYGVDAELAFGPISCKTEYLRASVRPATAPVSLDHGYYLQAALQLGKWYVAGRHDQAWTDAAAFSGQHRTALSIGRVLSPELQVRSQLNREWESGASELLFQLVAAWR